MSPAYQYPQHRAPDGLFVPPAEQREFKKGTGQMKRCGKTRRSHFTSPAGRVGKEQRIVKRNSGQDPDSRVEILQIRTTAKRDVLAIIDVLIARKHIRRCSTTQSRRSFE
jgi:hypothetical protein